MTDDLIPADRASEFFDQVQFHLGEHALEREITDQGLAVHESPEVVSFHTEDRRLTLILYRKADVVARQERRGQIKEITLHRAGETLGGWSDRGRPTSN